MIRNKEHLIFDIQEDKVRMTYNNQVIVFNRFNCTSRHKFSDFTTILSNSPKNRYDNLNDVFNLANRYEVRAVSGVSLTVHKRVAY